MTTKKNRMQQLSKIQSIIYHLYPGVVVAIGFSFLAPIVIAHGYPPQFAMLLVVVFIAVPILLLHLSRVKREENLKSLGAINSFTNRLSLGRLMLYALILVTLAFIVWGAAQPLDKFISEKLFFWLPHWYTVQDFSGYSNDAIKITLILNLAVNGVMAPVIEELYFRGYLLGRMQAWGKYAFLMNAVLFSLYHLWQPYIYLTLIFALVPMVYAVWKTSDLRLAIVTHCLMNLVGALLSFGLLNS